MAAELITRAELTTYASRSGATGFSDTQYDEAIAKATDKIRQAALNEYTAETFETLTATTTPDSMRDHAFALALGSLTKGDARRAETIGKAYDEAITWLGLLAHGQTHYDELDDAVLEKRTTGASRVTSYRASSERVFDRCNTSQTFNLRDEGI
jgi:hypothetical protein